MVTFVAFAPGQMIKARGTDLRGPFVVVQPFFTGSPPKLVYEARHALRGNSGSSRTTG